jgi:hypothetical protein
MLPSKLFNLLPFEAAHLSHKLIPMRQKTSDPVNLQQMCYPHLTRESYHDSLGNDISWEKIYASLANSPFPCEQEYYMYAVCLANGTTELDFLAHQQCYCNGGFFDAVLGCNLCWAAHGSYVYPLTSPEDIQEIEEQITSTVAMLSTDICSMAFSDLPTTPVQTSTNWITTLGSDRFPNDTRVENYWTATRSITPGKITGSATGRATTRSMAGDEASETYASTSKSSASKTSATSSAAAIESAGSSSVSPTPSATGGGAGSSDVRPVGGFLAAIMGLAVFL